jgi:protein tyrosine phosphatase
MEKFWKMIYVEKAELIVMLASLEEEEKQVLNLLIQ